MSRIGKKPIPIPSDVTVLITEGELSVKGPKGELLLPLHPDIRAELRGQEMHMVPARRTKKTPALWGLFRSLAANMVEGVVKGFEKKLQFEGIGFRANLDNGNLVMQLGFTHPVRIEPPNGIHFKVEKDTITVSGIDRGLVGQIAAKIRDCKPPEPYKGKGIRYQGEVIRRKAGKKAVASA